jgi:hypothetical protein
LRLRSRRAYDYEPLVHPRLAGGAEICQEVANLAILNLARAAAILTNGGLCMGMIRVQSARPFWVDTRNIDDL